MNDLPTGTVTFLFTDIEGSTRLLNEIGVQGYAEVRAEHHRLLREACSQHGGVEVDTAGDGLFAAFPTATGATTAAVDAQRALRGLVGVRMGLHSGEPVLTTDGYAGLDVVCASRIAGVAHGGQIVVSQTARDLSVAGLATGTTFRDLGVHRLKDLPRPQHLFQVVADRLPVDFPPVRSLENRHTNLPVKTNRLIGREDELRRLRELLGSAETRLVTLTGPGGSGKTRLALEAAADAQEHFRDGVFLVGLDGLDDTAQVARAILDALAVENVGRIPPEVLAREYLGERNVLLVLDSFEHLLEAAPLVGRLVEARGDSRILVTSVAPLRVAAETEFPVEPLALPDLSAPDVENGAVELFVERARAARPGLALTDDDIEAAARICVRLDGLPLAIELAAARIRVFVPTELVDRLERPLSILVGGGRDAPDRQRTLRATIDWSYRLLDAPTQRLFARLAVFAGGATLDAIEAVCRPGSEIGLDLVEGVGRLVETSLLAVREREGASRFVMLQTIREFAVEALVESSEEDEIRRRHAEYSLGDVEQVASFMAHDEAQGLQLRLELELDNVRSALDWAHEAGSPLELGLATLYQRSPTVGPAEGRLLLTRALQGDRGDDRRMRARALAAAGGLARMQGDPDAASRHFEESIQIYGELGDTVGLTSVMFRLSRTASDRDDFETATRIALECEAMARASGNDLYAGFALEMRGWLSLAQGELDEARGLLEESIDLLASPLDQMFAEQSLVYVDVLEGTAADALARATSVASRLDLDDPDQRFGWVVLGTLASALAAAGDVESAVRLYAAAQRWYGDRGVTPRFEAPALVWERVFGQLEHAAATPEFEEATREGRELDLRAAFELGLAAADRVRARA